MADTLLLADDSVTMQRVVELTFAQQGVKVVSVSDGHQAIDYITRQRPALALVSASLQKVNGFDVARYVRDHAESRVPVLLLAGAFDNLDEAQVRESGASGVLVKPFEPSVVIKRVKELLGLKSDRQSAESPASLSGRLVTSTAGPASAPDTPAGVSEALPIAGHDERDAADGEARGRDYLDHLDAAFDSLDAQLARKAAAAGRATNQAPTPTMPAALDPERRASTLGYGEVTVTDDAREAIQKPAAAEERTETDAKPVFEVDDKWFGNKPTVADSLGDLTEFVVTRASDFSSSSSAPAQGDQDRSWIPSSARDEGTSARDELTASLGGRTGADLDPPSPYASSPASARDELLASFDAPATSGRDELSASLGENASIEARETPSTYRSSPAAPSEDAPVSFNTPEAPRPAEPSGNFVPPSSAASVPASYGAPPPGTPADAFAMLWAQEQGEPAPPPAPLELSRDAVTAIAAQVTEGMGDRLAAELVTRVIHDLAPRMTNDLAPLVANDLAPRLSNELATRVGNDLAPRLVHELAPRLVNDLASRLADDLGARVVNELVERIGPTLIERLTINLGDRLAVGLAERVAELVAERAVQGALGESLRQTVNDVAERVVRAEIERLRAAAESLRGR